MENEIKLNYKEKSYLRQLLLREIEKLAKKNAYMPLGLFSEEKNQYQFYKKLFEYLNKENEIM